MGGFYPRCGWPNGFSRQFMTPLKCEDEDKRSTLLSLSPVLARTRGRRGYTAASMISGPDHEAQRLAALRQYEVLDTPPEAAYDELALLASRLCRTPMALIS